MDSTVWRGWSENWREGEELSPCTTLALAPWKCSISCERPRPVMPALGSDLKADSKLFRFIAKKEITQMRADSTGKMSVDETMPCSDMLVSSSVLAW